MIPRTTSIVLLTVALARVLSADNLFIDPLDDSIGPPLPSVRENGPMQPQFISAVQMAVHETDPQLFERSNRMVVHELTEAVSAFPALQNQRYEIRRHGNEVVFYLVTNEDLRNPMQDAIATMIQSLNGRVRTKGRSLFYRTRVQDSVGGYLEVKVDDTHTRVQSITAQSVPLRDLLKELKAQLGGLSYLIPGECANRLVDWSFGGEDSTVAGPREGQDVGMVMRQLARLFGLQSGFENGTYVFTGNCQTAAEILPHPPELLTTQLNAVRRVSERPTRVYFPLLPID